MHTRAAAAKTAATAAVAEAAAAAAIRTALAPTSAASTAAAAAAGASTWTFLTPPPQALTPPPQAPSQAPPQACVLFLLQLPFLPPMAPPSATASPKTSLVAARERRQRQTKAAAGPPTVASVGAFSMPPRRARRRHNRGWTGPAQRPGTIPTPQTLQSRLLALMAGAGLPLRLGAAQAANGGAIAGAELSLRAVDGVATTTVATSLGPLNTSLQGLSSLRLSVGQAPTAPHTCVTAWYRARRLPRLPGLPPALACRQPAGPTPQPLLRLLLRDLAVLWAAVCLRTRTTTTPATSQRPRLSRRPHGNGSAAPSTTSTSSSPRRCGSREALASRHPRV